MLETSLPIFVCPQMAWWSWGLASKSEALTGSRFQERACLGGVGAENPANRDGHFDPRPHRCASAAQRGLETRRRPALRRLGNEQGLRDRPRFCRRGILVIADHPGGLPA